MADLIARVDDEGDVVFEDPLDDSGESPRLQRASLYYITDIIGLLQDLGFNVDDQVPEDFGE